MASAPPPSTMPLPVFSLQCHHDNYMSIQFLPTLLRRCKDPIELIINDDGSLTEEDRDRLRENLGPVRIISLEEGRDLVLPKLAGRPNCIKYRLAHHFGIKLFDAAMISGGPFALCDGDIIFLRDFGGLDRRSWPGEDLVHMKDFISSYVFPLRERYFGRYRIPMADYVNAGLLYGAPRAFDLDFIEWYLGNPDFPHSLHTSEQTVWGGLAARVKARYFVPEQVDFAFASLEERPDWVALHVVGPLRYLLREPGYLDHLWAYAAKQDGGDVATLRTRRAIRHNLAQYVLTRGYRKLRPHHIRTILDHGPIRIGGAQQPA